jgi:acyl-CoA thioesterase FadM
VAGLEIHFRAETTYGDTVLAQAGPAEADGGLVFAHQLRREADGRLVALARTRWSTR